MDRYLPKPSFLTLSLSITHTHTQGCVGAKRVKMRKEKHAGKCIYIGESFWDGKGKGIDVPEESQAVSQKLHVSISAPPASAIKKKNRKSKSSKIQGMDVREGGALEALSRSRWRKGGRGCGRRRREQEGETVRL